MTDPDINQKTIDIDKKMAQDLWCKFRCTEKLTNTIGGTYTCFEGKNELDRNAGVDALQLIDGLVFGISIRTTQSWTPIETALTFRVEKETVGKNTEVAKARKAMEQHALHATWIAQVSHWHKEFVGMLIVKFEDVMPLVDSLITSGAKPLHKNTDGSKFIKILPQDLDAAGIQYTLIK